MSFLKTPLAISVTENLYKGSNIDSYQRKWERKVYLMTFMCFRNKEENGVFQRTLVGRFAFHRELQIVFSHAGVMTVEGSN